MRIQADPDLGQTLESHKVEFSRVSDLYSFFTDPDPDPVDPDGGQYGSGYDPDPDTDPDPIRIQGFNDQKLKKNNI